MHPTELRCPDCTNRIDSGTACCPSCRLPLTGPVAAQLWQVDQALAANRQQRDELLTRREGLLRTLRAPVQQPAGPPVPVPSAQPGPSAQTVQTPTGSPWLPQGALPVPRRETSPRSVQNLLLALGGLLLAVAAVIFTVVAWGRFGLAGRAAILFTFTVVTLVLPVMLIRRKLSATAETLSLVGLVLIGMDGYAAYAVGAFGLDRVSGFGYAAAVCAVVAAFAAAYPLVVPVRALRPVGVVIAQLPAPLLAISLHANATGAALTATIVAGLDVALVALIRGRRSLAPEMWIAACSAVVAAVLAAPPAILLTLLGDHRHTGAGVLALLGTVAVAAAMIRSAPALRTVLAGIGSLLLATAAIGVALPGLGEAGPLAPAVAGTLLAATGLVLSTVSWRRGPVIAGVVLLAAGGLPLVEPLAVAVVGPFGWLISPWTGAGGSARVALSPQLAWSGSPSVLPSVLMVSAGLVVGALALLGRRAALVCGGIGVVLATVVAPVALDLTRIPGLILQGAIAATLILLAAALRRRTVCICAGLGGLALTAITLAVALAEPGSTVVALLVATAIFLCAALGARSTVVGATAAGLLVATAAGAASALVLANGGVDTAAIWTALAVAGLAAATVALQILPRRPALALAVTIGIVSTSAVAGAFAAARFEYPGLALAASGGLMVAAAIRRPRGGERELFVGVAGLPLLAALAAVTEPQLQAYLGPYARLGAGWGPAPASARAALARVVGWSGDPTVPAVLAVVAVAGATALLALMGRRAALCLAVPALALSAGLLPVALDLSWAAALLISGFLACALLAAATLARADDPVPPIVTGPAAIFFASTTIASALAAAPATVIALTTTALVSLGAAMLARTRGVTLIAIATGGSAAVLAAVTAAMAAGQPARLAAFAALAVAAGLAAVAGVLRRDRADESLCCEAVAAAGAVLGIALSSTRPLTLSIALAATGLVVGAVALREDRRPASYVSTALVLIASWVRLAELGVSTPEAYTVPVAVAGLVIGWLRWRQRRELSSWLVFGPGLALGLVSSLVALVVEPANVVRALALGIVALVVLLTGGRYRLQAPLLIGGGVLAAVATHELAPAVTNLITSVPRWVPLAAAGLLLVVLGATYEHRLRDMRRLRKALARMS